MEHKLLLVEPEVSLSLANRIFQVVLALQELILSVRDVLRT